MSTPPRIRRQGEETELHVLVVEDDPDDAATVRLALGRRKGVSATFVRTAQEALEKHRLHSFDAFLLDNRLPDISGIRLCEMLRKGGEKAPIIVLSSVAQDAMVERAFKAGASDYVVKDVANGKRLDSLVHGLVGR